MSDRYTVEHVRHVANLVRIQAAELDLVPNGCDELHLQIGSKTYGRAWRIYWVDSASGAYTSAFNLTDGYIGDTAREAYNVLRAIWRTLGTVDAQRIASRA